MYRKISTGWLKHWDFELLDLFCIEIAFFVAYFLRHRDVIASTMDWYFKLGAIMLLIQCVVVLFENNYKGILHRNAWSEALAVVRHVTIIQGIFIIYEFIMKETGALSRYVIVVSWWLSLILCFLGRIALKAIVRSYLADSRHQSKLLVLTEKSKAEVTIQKLLAKPVREYRITAIAMPEQDRLTDCDDLEVHINRKTDFVYGEEEFWEYVRTNVVDEVFIDSFYDTESLKHVILQLLTMGVTVHIGMNFLPDELPNKFVEKIGATHVVTTTIKTARTWEIGAKRLMDIIGGLVGLVLTGIAYLFVAPAIMLASPGPIFFKQERVGRNGRSFYIYKFRSMYMDAEERKKELMEQNEMQGLMFKMENDPRIIGSEKGPGKGLGNFIRKTSIDELPQFWNILKGDMSLVGTRPPTKQEYEQYELHHKIRLSMKPGLTGMWQTSGRSEITDFEEVVRLDANYIENWSLWLDIKLLFKTIIVVLDRKGSK